MPDVVVVGAGAFGAWTAHHLLASGARVTLVEAYGPAHDRASSGDASRISRSGYGPDAIYTEWARRSLVMWQECLADENDGQLPLFHRSGVLWLAAGDDPYTTATLDTLRRVGQPVEVLSPALLGARFPQIAAGDIEVALLEPEAGVLMARRAVQTLVASLRRRGVPLIDGRVAAVRTVPASTGTARAVVLADGREVGANAFVFACGPWLPKIFPALLADRIRPTRQTVMYFGVPPGDDRFGPSRMPAWVDFASGIYGVPDVEACGVKVGLDAHGPPFDPDTGDRTIDDGSVDTARRWLRRRLPALAEAPLVSARVCQYENSSNGDFLIDRHPELENVWIAGGGSGHGFKHGPMVGAYVASLVGGTGTPERRFQLSAKETAAARSIY